MIRPTSSYPSCFGRSLQRLVQSVIQQSQRLEEMNDVCSYIIKLHGQVTQREINALSPIQVKVEQLEPAATLLSVCMDQSGLIGLMRHLHGMGFVFVSMNCVEENTLP